jgi:energy-coupling factor transporter ATP-binding protein EcfA2
MDVQLPNNEVIVGDKPIVVIGANGSGKSTLAKSMNSGGRYRYIAASKTVGLQERLDRGGEQSFDSKLNRIHEDVRANPSSPQSDFHMLLRKVVTKHEEELLDFVEPAAPKTRVDGTRPETTLDRVLRIWRKLLPQRNIVIKRTGEVSAQSGDVAAPFSATRLSDGERAALYYATSVLSAPRGLVIVDEPETFLHPALSRELWTILETERTDCRFVYVTHSINFAISRVGATWIVCEKLHQYNIYTEAEYATLPAMSLLGARTFAISASEVIFCEGQRFGDKNLDWRFYHAWFASANAAITVEPVGSCERVLDCVRGLPSLRGTVSVRGIIDRDDRSDDECAQHAGVPGLSVLPFFELESLLCHEAMFNAVVHHVTGQAPAPDL